MVKPMLDVVMDELPVETLLTQFRTEKEAELPGAYSHILKLVAPITQSIILIKVS